MKKQLKSIALLLMIFACLCIFIGCDNGNNGDDTPIPPSDCKVTFMLTDTVTYWKTTVQSGGKVDMPANPTRAGYIFENWQADQQPFDENFSITADIIIYAKWTKLCRVRYLMPNDTEIFVEEVVEGQSVQYSQTPPSYQDEYFSYVFDKWVTEKDGNVTADLSCVTKHTKVYAKFVATLKITDVKGAVDFCVEVPSGRDVKILQLTDTQIIDGSQQRYEGRVFAAQATDSVLQNNCFKYVDYLIELSQPDLIFLTGDIVYGEFDDNGSVFTKIVQYLDSFDIPWAPVFGNHDNESQKGVAWQCQQFEMAKNCLFKRRELTGNGNYNVGIIQQGKLVKVLYMLDSNGCTAAYRYFDANGNEVKINQTEKQVKTTIGFGVDQLDWVKQSSALIDLVAGYSVSKFLAFHIPTAEFADAVFQAGYQSNAVLDNDETYVIGIDVTAQNGDFGCKGEPFKGCHREDGFFELLKNCNFDGVFVGHSHKNNVSVLYNGVRFTFGLKSSAYDRYTSGQIGGTLVSVVQDGSFTVQHIYYV